MNVLAGLTPNSLLDQFQGAWIGAQVGVNLARAQAGSLAGQIGQPSQSGLFLPLSQPFSPRSESAALNLCQNEFRYSLACAESLIQHGGVHRSDLHDRWQAVTDLTPDKISLADQLAQSCLSLEEVLLPLMLYCHEDQETLKREIEAIGQSLGQPLVPIRRCQLVGVALARLLRRHSHPTNLAQHLLEAGLTIDDATAALADLITQVDHLVQHRSGLAAVLQACHGQPISLTPLMVSLYCVATAPYTPALAIGRTLWSDCPSPIHQPVLSAMLAGMVSGLYNKWAAIPLNWQLTLGPTQVEIRQTSMTLLASWSGADMPQSFRDAAQTTLAVTAPNAMRLG